MSNRQSWEDGTDGVRDDNIIPSVDANRQAVKVWHPDEPSSAGNADRQALEQQQLERYSPFSDVVIDRRRFLKIMLASMGAAGITHGLTGCVKAPAEEIVPYVHEPEMLVPGMPNYYSSVFTRGGYGFGVIVESHQGRPTKVEGNPRHPATLGASDVFMQAELLNLYDPDRSRVIENNGKISSQGELERVLANKRREWARDGGQGLRILTPLISSPSLAAQLHQLLERYPNARWHQWQPINDDHALQGARLAFGQDVAPQYHLRQADIVLQLDGDLLSELPGSLHYARDFAQRRKPLHAMSRIYAVESKPGLMGAMADHRVAASAPLVEQFAAYLVANAGGSDPELQREHWPDLQDSQRAWLDACLAELQTHGGRSLVVVGMDQSPAVHALGHWLNAQLGNVGATVTYHEPVAQRSEVLVDSLRELSAAMEAGAVDTVLFVDTNPVFNAPADFQFGKHLKQVPFSLHMGLYNDETAALAQWHVPRSHMLESWGDARAYDGTLAIQQPLISPLYDTSSPYGLLSFINGDGWRSDYESVRTYWRGRLGEEGFELQWRKMLIAGVLENSQAPRVQPALKHALLNTLSPPRALDDGLVLQFAPDPRMWDGAYANNAWLQELSQPLTKLTWGNALLISPGLAKQLDVQSGDDIEVDSGGARIVVPAWVMPGHPDNAVTVNLGYGRHIAAKQPEPAISHGVGVNAYPLRTSHNLSLSRNVQLRKTGQRTELARTQHHDSMEGRLLARHATLDHFEEHPDFIASDKSAHDPDISLYPEPDPDPFKTSQYDWGMSIDLNSCMGCGACTLACQAENNIPVVGREQVLAGREMHWLRIDRYYTGNPLSDGNSQNEKEGQESQELRTYFQPMMCQHCENAPCEYVCPVGATVHDSEGLNVMVYNRCIGTRDCSQNCPYKVRRFNFLEYNYDSPRTKAIAPVRNPDVSVRSRGVMEKCTYCLQRISQARKDSKKDMREIADGEVQTACQQACPTQAIVFGNINDKGARVTQAKQSPLSYSVLAELNTRPRTTYTARIHNTNSTLTGNARKGHTGTEGND